MAAALLLASSACTAPKLWVPGRDASGAETVETLPARGTSETEGLMPETTASSQETTLSPTVPPTAVPSQTTVSPAQDTPTAATPSPPVSDGAEMRGVWVSYLEVAAMLKGKSAADARKAIDTLMDNVRSYGLNTVVFHVRANSDAYYNSSIFKHASAVSGLLAGGFDPLAYAVEAAHRRGLALHAWINPYRIGTDASYNKLPGAGDSFSLTSGGTVSYYYNPASAAAQSLILDGVAEVASNYAVDGIQFDDYFYPSNISASQPESFETAAYTAYRDGGGGMDVGGWRRTQVSTLISSVYATVKEKRPSAVFGISPRGIRDQNYNIVYADVELWMRQERYVDYICPQIYFGFQNNKQPYEATVDAWLATPRHASVKLYVGLALYKAGIADDAYAFDGRGEWKSGGDIMKRSVEYLRQKQNCGGMMFYSYTYFNPSAKAESGSWMKSVAVREVENLLSVLT